MTIRIISTKEKWLPISGWDGLYEISSIGRVRDSSGEIVLLRKSGTYWVAPLVNNKGRTIAVLVHWAACRTFHGPAPGPTGRTKGSWQVDHIDERRLNNRATNLRWVTQKFNVSRGTVQGEEASNAKLTEEQAREIIVLLETTTIPFIEIAARYEVSEGSIFHIAKRETWKRLKRNGRVLTRPNRRFWTRSERRIYLDAIKSD